MLYTLTTFIALALVGAAHAKPLIASSGALGHPIANSVDISKSFPVVDLGSVAATPDVTVGGKGAHVDVTAAIYPATLLLCESDGCANCAEFDLSAIPHETCLASSIEFFSVGISQPSNAGLPFGVFVGPPGCDSFGQIPAVNTCYNIIDGPFDDVVLSP